METIPPYAMAVSGDGFFRGLWRAAQQVFHEVTGIFFGLFAADGAVLVWRTWRHSAGELLVALAAAFTLMMALFAASSFRRARRVR